MTTSPQFKQAILSNLERLNTLNIPVTSYATLTMSLKDYSAHKYLNKQKSTNRLFKNLFLQRVF
jgi:hypothetical protein